MKNPFLNSSDNKRYYTLHYHNKRIYGKKVMKAVVDCGMTCPNIDGKKGYGGCIFCDNGSGYFTRPELSVAEQLDSEITRLRRKFGSDVSAVAYFQANTNTYAPVDVLENIWYEALKFPEICGISIGTRADCINAEVLEALNRLNSKTDLTVELGMQTIHENTLSLLNICCTHKEFIQGYNMLKSSGIRVCLHIINGLPSETPEMMLETAVKAGLLKPDAIKLQMLHVIKGTKLSEMYANNEFKLLTKDEYIDIVVKQLEVLPPDTVIERITGHGD